MDRETRTLVSQLCRSTAQFRRCGSKHDIQRLLIARATRRAIQNKRWLLANEAEFLASTTCGRSLDPRGVQPVVESVRTTVDRRLFRYARFTSSIPFTDRVGRRIRFLIRDASLANRPIMGIAALGSPLLDLQPRDRWLFQPFIDRVRKHRLLAHVAELYVAVGIPPYSDLLAGKLICYCMASMDIAEMYNSAYATTRQPLLALYT